MAKRNRTAPAVAKQVPTAPTVETTVALEVVEAPVLVAEPGVQPGNEPEAPTSSDGEMAALDDALAALNLMDSAIENIAFDAVKEDDEVIAPRAPDDNSTGDDVLDDLLDEVGAEADAASARHALYSKQPGESVETNPPETKPDDLLAPKGTRKRGSSKTAEPKAPKAPKAVKPLRATSVTHSPGDLLREKLGPGGLSLLALTLDDAKLKGEALATKQGHFLAIMNDREAMARKVKEKAMMLLTWLKDGGEMNTVLRRTMLLLIDKGELTSGDKGNLQQNLLMKPYSKGTAQSQANQMFMLLPALKICKKEKGKMVPNPDSALLPIIKERLNAGGD